MESGIGSGEVESNGEIFDESDESSEDDSYEDRADGDLDYGGGLEITCDWRELLTAFFAEEKFFINLMHNSIEARSNVVDGLKHKLDASNSGDTAAIIDVLYRFQEIPQINRLRARDLRCYKQEMQLGLFSVCDNEGDFDDQIQKRLRKAGFQFNEYGRY